MRTLGLGRRRCRAPPPGNANAIVNRSFPGPIRTRRFLMATPTFLIYPAVLWCRERPLVISRIVIGWQYASVGGVIGIVLAFSMYEYYNTMRISMRPIRHARSLVSEVSVYMITWARDHCLFFISLFASFSFSLLAT